MGANGVGNIYILRVTVQLTCFEKSGASVAPLSSLLFTLFKKFAELCSLFFKFFVFLPRTFEAGDSHANQRPAADSGVSELCGHSALVPYHLCVDWPGGVPVANSLL